MAAVSGGVREGDGAGSRVGRRLFGEDERDLDSDLISSERKAVGTSSLHPQGLMIRTSAYHDAECTDYCR
jgi:hypothetical protein